MIQRIIRTKGAELAIYDYGFKASTDAAVGMTSTSSINRTPVLFSHPTGFHGRVFDQSYSIPIIAINQLSEQFHCVSLDHRGHGQSTHNSTSNNVCWQEIGNDITHLITDARKDVFVNVDECKPIVGVGHSMGATALIVAALEKPELFKGLILYEPILFPFPYRFLMNRMDTVPIGQAARKRRPHFPSKKDALMNYRAKSPLNSLHPEVLKDYVEHGFEDDVPTPTPAAPSPSAPEHEAPTNATATTTTEERVLLRCRPDYEARVYNGARKLDLFDTSLYDLKIPVWIVAGKSEFLQPSMLAYLIHLRIPNSKLIRWNDTGHFGPLVFPDRWADLVSSF